MLVPFRTWRSVSTVDSVNGTTPYSFPIKHNLRSHAVARGQPYSAFCFQKYHRRTKRRVRTSIRFSERDPSSDSPPARPVPPTHISFAGTGTGVQSTTLICIRLDARTMAGAQSSEAVAATRKFRRSIRGDRGYIGVVVLIAPFPTEILRDRRKPQVR
jgi:hypothetical protein